MIIFKICSDLSHDIDNRFKHAFTLSMYCEHPTRLSKKDKRDAIIEFMKEFGPVDERWIYAAPDQWFVYVRFREEEDAMMFKLIKG